MRKLFSAVSGSVMLLSPTMALAEEVGGYSRGNAFMYFSAIAVVLIYGIHDVFRNRWVTWISAVVIPIALYLALPAE